MTAQATQYTDSGIPRHQRTSRLREKAEAKDGGQPRNGTKPGKKDSDGEAPRGPDTLRLFANRGQSVADVNGEAAVAGVAMNAFVAKQFCFGPFRELDVTACFDAMAKAAGQVNAGDLSGPEALLTSQSVTLNAIFGKLACRAHQAQYVAQFETYMRLALRAQGQCRATCEALAVLKNPPVFAKQANISHGPQQVNNSQGTRQVYNAPGSETAQPPRARETGSPQNELLEAEHGTRQLESGQRLDAGTSRGTGTRDPGLAPGGVLNRPENR
jgi:hypothetical protein